jgi:hypothetical protein
MWSQTVFSCSHSCCLLFFVVKTPFLWLIKFCGVIIVPTCFKIVKKNLFASQFDTQMHFLLINLVLKRVFCLVHEMTNIYKTGKPPFWSLEVYLVVTFVLEFIEIAIRSTNVSFISHFGPQMCFSLVNLVHKITKKRHYGCVCNFDTFRDQYDDSELHFQGLKWWFAL